MQFTASCAAALVAFSAALPLPAPAQSPAAFVVKPVAEKKAASLPEGPLFWRIESVPSLAQAQSAAGAYAIAGEAWGRAWLFTLGPRGASTPGTERVAEIGPIPKVAAPEYLLRINVASGAPGSTSAVHTHPGSEAFFVLEGEQSIRTPAGVKKVDAGRAETGPGADTPLQVSSTGPNELKALVLFVVDAQRPFSSPASMN